MATRLKLPARDPGVKIELGDQSTGIVEYRLKPITMEIEEELSDCERRAREVEGNPDSRPLDLCEAELAQLDIVLEPMPRPAGDIGNGDPLPSTKLLGDPGDPGADPPKPKVPGYKTGDVTRSQIRSLVERVTAAARPT